jgi:hypothetical protein
MTLHEFPGLEQGKCRCGCGGETPLATRTITRRGITRGRPVPYLYGHDPTIRPLPIPVRFAGFVNQTDTCWLWTGPVNNGGYGKFWLSGRTVGAHRLAYTLANGPIPPGLVVRHTCDVPACVNPEHLLVGTQQDNENDKIARGRTPSAERNGRAKLTSDQVREMREMHKRERLRQIDLAERFGVCKSTVGYVLSGQHWKDVA